MYAYDEADYDDIIDDDVNGAIPDNVIPDSPDGSDSLPGASSEKESDEPGVTGDPSGDDLAFLKNVRAAARLVSNASDDVAYAGDNPVDTLIRVLGLKRGNPIYECMSYRCPKGKDLGCSVFSWARSWNVKTHPDGHGYTMVERGSPKSWDYHRIWDKISQATANCKVDSAPLQLLAICLVAPRTISDQIANGALKDIKDHGEESSCLLAWQDINNKSPPKEIANIFTKFIGGCRRMLKQAKEDMIALSTAEKPHKHNPILLLREYVSMPGKVKDQYQHWSRIFAREKEIIEKISEHSDGTEINWSMRRLLYVELLTSSKRWLSRRESLMPFMERIRSAKNPDDIMTVLTEAAYESKFTSIDTFLNLKRGIENFPTNDNAERDTKKTRTTTENNTNEVVMTPRQKLDSCKNDETDVIRRAPRAFNPPAHIKSVATANGINQHDLMVRMNKKLCVICGDSGHLFANCPSAKVSSAYPDGCCATINSKCLSNRLLVETVTISVAGCKPVAARCGFDTMASISVISESFVALLLEGDNRLQHKPIVKHPQGRIVNGLNSSLILDEVITIDVNFRGYECKQECWIIPDNKPGLPAGIDMNIGYQDLSSYGVSISVPKSRPTGKVSFKILIDLAVEQLILQAGTKHPLPGASRYQGLLRPLKKNERKDTPRQRWVYEIHWDMKDEPSEMHRSHDYSTGMFANLSPNQKDLAQRELQKLVGSGWWWSEDCPEPPIRLSDATVLPDDIVSFPLSQGQHKSTKVRLCSDARKLNSRIWKASYHGLAVSDCLNTLRGNYVPGDSITFIDLENAFYKIRLGSNRVLRITSNGRHYYTNCVIFGLSFGPCSLGGKVLVLLNAVFSVLLGREIRMKSIEEASVYFSDVIIVVFYDDICVMGNPTKCATIIYLLCYIAQLVGDSFPEEKREEITKEGTPCRHLGVLWSKDPNDRLVLSCVPIEQSASFAPEIVSRRDIFSLAGHRYDPLKLHPIARLVADRMRRWAGRSEGGNSRSAWNRRWELTAKQMGTLQCLLSLADQDMNGACEHRNFPPDFSSIVAYSDACVSGFGFSICITNAEYSVDDPATWMLIEECADEYGDKQRSWHINRKECHPMLSVLRRILYWIRILRRRIHSINIFSDNSSALSWAGEKPLKEKLIENVELERMINSMKAIVDTLRTEHSCDVHFAHIKGSSNKRADFLSRALSSVPQIDPLGNMALKKRQTEPNDIAMVVMSPCGELTVSDNINDHYRGLGRIPLKDAHSHDTADMNSNEDVICVIADDNTTQAEKTTVDFDSLDGIGDLSELDIVQHVREALADQEYTKKKSIFGITIFDILNELGVIHSTASISPGAKAFVAGGAHGKYLKWDHELNILLVSDPLEDTPRWRIYLPSKRSRQWVVYKYHDHAYLSMHRSLGRVLAAVRDPPKGYPFWWDGMTKDISRMIRCCEVCQLNKHHDIMNRSPLVLRRWQRRFQRIQLDFAGPFRLTDQNDPSPWESEYLCLMICECTHMSLAVPTKSTSARDVMGALLIWFSIYGTPEVIQLDACPAHDSETLRQFTSAWGAEISLGIPRRPESQGLIERLIRDVKTAIRLGTKAVDASTPWWICAFNAITIHNSSPIQDGLGCTPSYLAHYRDQLIAPELDPVNAQDTDSPMAKNYAYLSDLMQCFSCSRADAALRKEVKNITENILKYRFNPGDEVKISRIINGRRQVTGPFKILRKHPSNAMLFFIEGFDKPFSASQILPFYSDADREALNHATVPTRVATAIIGKSDMPDGIKLDELKKDEHWIVYKESDDSSSSEPLLMIYAARFLSIDFESEEILIQGLDHNCRDNSWILPPKKERHLAVKAIPLNSVIGGAGFKPTCRGTVPRNVRIWFAEQGCEV